MSARLPSPEWDEGTSTPEKRDSSPNRQFIKTNRDGSPDRKPVPGGRDSPRKPVERNVQQKSTNPTPRGGKPVPNESNKRDLSKPQPKPERVDRSKFQRAPVYQKEDRKDSKRSSRESGGLPFLKEDDYTNVILIVEGKKLYIHSSLLGYASPYFDDVFREAGGHERKTKLEHRVEEKSYNDFVELLSYLHPAVGKELNDKTALRLLPLAHEYQIESLKEKCEKFLAQSLRKSEIIKETPKRTKGPENKTNDSLLLCLVAADQGQSKHLLQQCIKAYSQSDNALKELRSCNDVSDAVKAEIFEKRVEITTIELAKVTSELEKEKKENEILKRKIGERGASKNRGDNKQGRDDKRDKSLERDKGRNFRGRVQNRGRPR